MPPAPAFARALQPGLPLLAMLTHSMLPIALSTPVAPHAAVPSFGVCAAHPRPLLHRLRLPAARAATSPATRLRASPHRLRMSSSPRPQPAPTPTEQEARPASSAPASPGGVTSHAPGAWVSSLSDDIEELWTLPCNVNGCLIGDAELADCTRLGILVSTDSSITSLWTLEAWQKHTSPSRLWRHIVRWPRSTILNRLLPCVLVFMGWTVLVHALRLPLPPAVVTYAGSPLALLLAFRVNAANSRFFEARKQWGRAIYAARELSSVIAYAQHMPQAAKELACRALCCYGWAMKASLRGEPELRSVLQSLLPEAATERVLAARKPPTALLSLVRSVASRHALRLDVAQAVATHVADLNQCFGGMERILSTPLSPTYGRHTTRGLVLWLLMLPCALVGAGTRSLLPMLIAEATSAYIMLGIEEIGIQIEQPFDVLPLHGMSVVLTKDVRDEALAATTMHTVLPA